MLIDRSIDRLIDWCFTARQHMLGQFVPIYQGGLLAQAFEDSQRGTYKNIQLHAIRFCMFLVGYPQTLLNVSSSSNKSKLIALASSIQLGLVTYCLDPMTNCARRAALCIF